MTLTSYFKAFIGIDYRVYKDLCEECIDIKVIKVKTRKERNFSFLYVFGIMMVPSLKLLSF